MKSGSVAARSSLAMALVVAVMALVLVACGSQAASVPPAASVDPADGVAIHNTTDRPLSIVYERPDETTEPLVDLAAGQAIVVGQLFADRDGLCRTGRLVALEDGTEVASLYLVCKGQDWVIEAP